MARRQDRSTTEQAAVFTPPDAVQRPRFKSIVVGSIHVPANAGCAWEPAPTARKHVNFAFPPPNPAGRPSTKRQYSPQPALLPLKSCLKPESSSHAARRSVSGSFLDAPNCCAPFTNGVAPSQGPGDATGRHGVVLGEDGWSPILPRHWWRRADFRSAEDSRNPVARSPPRRSAVSKRLCSKCIRCLGSGHLAADCRDPVRCLRCGRVGHKAKECRAVDSLVHPPR